MADQTARQERFLAKRVRALAVMLLTRRSDLQVEEVQEDAGLDLVVRIVPEGREGVRPFGVGLRGARSSVTKGHAGRVLQRSLREAQAAGPFAFPVCLLFFTMEENQGWYTWVAEPVVERGKAHLRLRPEPDCRPLDEAALDEVVARVDRWYDAFFANLITNAAGRGRTGRRQADG